MGKSDPFLCYAAIYNGEGSQNERRNFKCAGSDGWKY